MHCVTLRLSLRFAVSAVDFAAKDAKKLAKQRKVETSTRKKSSLAMTPETAVCRFGIAPACCLLLIKAKI
jgi:hypothetical protein